MLVLQRPEEGVRCPWAVVAGSWEPLLWGLRTELSFWERRSRCSGVSPGPSLPLCLLRFLFLDVLDVLDGLEALCSAVRFWIAGSAVL